MKQLDLSRFAFLRPGQQHRIPHCGRTKHAVISRQGQEIVLHCFKCGGSDRVSSPLGMKDAVNLLREATSAKTSNALLNGLDQRQTLSGLSPIFPPRELRYLADFGIGPDAQESNGLQYSTSMSRIVFPIRNASGGWDGWVARRVWASETSPKWLTSESSKGLLYKPVQVSKPTGLISTCLCLTEDAVSAIRISHSGCQSMSLLGTALSMEKSVPLLKFLADAPMLSSVMIWLDPDRAGQRAFSKIGRRVSMLTSLPCFRVKSKRDPKYYTDAQIEEILNECRDGKRTDL